MSISNFTYGLNSEIVTPTWSLTTPNATYPAVNAGNFTDEMYATPALSTATTDDLIGTFGAAQRVDWLVLWHNLSASLANVKVEMNAANSWGSPTISIPITVPAKRKNGHTQKIFVDLTAAAGYTTAGKQYIRVHMGTANSAPVGLKVMAFSNKRNFGKHVRVGFKPQRQLMGIELTSEIGHTWAYDKKAAPRLLIGQLDLTDSGLASLIDWYEDSAFKLTALAAVDPQYPLEAYIVRLRSSNQSSLLNANGPTTITVSPTLHPSATQNYSPVQFAAEEVTAGYPEWT